LATARLRLARDLRDAGLQVTDVWQLVNSRQSYPAAVPILVRWLDLLGEEVPLDAERRELLEGVVRALTVREARPAAAGPLIRLFRRFAINDQALGWVIGNAVHEVAVGQNADEVLGLVLDDQFGAARQMLAASLARIGKGRRDIGAALAEVVTDDDLTAFVIPVLASLNPDVARALVPTFLKSSRPLVREKARKAMKLIERHAPE
jgi:hypothetical protein